MTKIVIIIDEDGAFVSALSDSEVDFAVLKKGRNDAAIDRAESELTELEQE